MSASQHPGRKRPHVPLAQLGPPAMSALALLLEVQQASMRLIGSALYKQATPNSPSPDPLKIRGQPAGLGPRQRLEGGG
jgi:hypothetical protein